MFRYLVVDEMAVFVPENPPIIFAAGRMPAHRYLPVEVGIGAALTRDHAPYVTRFDDRPDKDGRRLVERPVLVLRKYLLLASDTIKEPGALVSSRRRYNSFDGAIVVVVLVGRDIGLRAPAIYDVAG